MKSFINTRVLAAVQRIITAKGYITIDDKHGLARKYGTSVDDVEAAIKHAVYVVGSCSHDAPRYIG